LNVVLHSAIDNEAAIQLFDYTGKLVYQESFITGSGANAKRIALDQLKSGLYLLTTVVNGQLNSSDKVFIR